MPEDDVPTERPEGTDVVNDSLETPLPDLDPSFFQDDLEVEAVDVPEAVSE